MVVSLNQEDIEKIARMVAVGAAATIATRTVGASSTYADSSRVVRDAKVFENYILGRESE